MPPAEKQASLHSFFFFASSPLETCTDLVSPPSVLTDGRRKVPFPPACSPPSSGQGAPSKAKGKSSLDVLCTRSRVPTCVGWGRLEIWGGNMTRERSGRTRTVDGFFFPISSCSGILGACAGRGGVERHANCLQTFSPPLFFTKTSRGLIIYR